MTVESGKPPRAAQKTIQKRNRDTTSIFHRFWMDFGRHFGPVGSLLVPFGSLLVHFFPPMSRKPADFSLPISLLQVAGVPGVRRCRSASTMMAFHRFGIDLWHPIWLNFMILACLFATFLRQCRRCLPISCFQTSCFQSPVSLGCGGVALRLQ